MIEFVSDVFLRKMTSREYLPLVKGWFGLKVKSVERDEQNCGYIYNLEKNI